MTSNEEPNNTWKQLSADEKRLIIMWDDQGYCPARIAALLHRNRSTISRFLLRHENESSDNSTENRGKERITSEREDRRILNLVERDRFVTTKEILEGLDRQNVSRWTVARRIRESGDFASYWAAQKPFLREKNRVHRLKWCQEHQDWTKEQWHRVLWSDESPFVLRYPGKKRVWRKTGERYSQRCTQATVKHDVKIMIWGCFAGDKLGPLHLIEGIMDQHVYRDILETYVRPTVNDMFGGENYYFQQDNDPKHKSKRCQEYLAYNNITTIEWPAQSPDLNPIENLWSILDQNTRDRKVNSKTELFEHLRQAWLELPKSLLTDLVNSMPRRIAAVIEANGMATKY